MLRKCLFLAFCCFKYLALSQVVAAPLPENDSLSLPKAMEKVLNSHPGLAGAQSEILARKGIQLQASKRTNPELGFEVEDFAGSKEYRGFNGAQTTLQLSQNLEWMGKQGKRKKIAGIELNLAERAGERKRLDLMALTQSQFLEALYFQKLQDLAKESKTLAQALLAAVMHRVKEGAASSVDEIRARLALSEADLEIRQDSLRYDLAKRKLALLWGEESSPKFSLQGDWQLLPPIPTLEEMYRRLLKSPQTLMQMDSIRLAEAQLQRQLMLNHPDITVSAGLRHSAIPGSLAWVGGISMPLPFINRNQGGKMAAEQELAKAKFESKAALLELKNELMEINITLQSAQSEIEALRENLIPEAERAAQVLEEGYRRGRFGILDVLNAESDLFRHRMRYLNALLKYRQGLVGLERLIGTEEK